jgi:CRISPR-associated protein Cas2
MRYVLACYDLADQKRRTKLHRLLRGALRPVQESVFEGTLPAPVFERLLLRAPALLEPDTDRLRVWSLCAACQRGGLFWGNLGPAPGPEDLVL